MTRPGVFTVFHIYQVYLIKFEIKEDVGLRVTDGIRKDFEDVSLNMVTVLFWVQQLFPNLME